MAQQELVVVLDFGGQYTQLIARKIRQLHVYCEILPYKTPWEKIKERHPKALIFTGDSQEVYKETAPAAAPEAYRLGLPILALGAGVQVMAKDLGGTIRPGEHDPGKKIKMTVLKENDLFAGLAKEILLLPEQGKVVEKVPEGFTVLAATEMMPVAAMAHLERKFYAVSCHPQALETPAGTKVLANFLFKIAGLTGDWNIDVFIENTVQRIREAVGENEQVVCGLSGGVDSSVAAALVHKAIGDGLTCIFVDHGLLRQDEARQVMATFQENLKMKVIKVDAAAEFLHKLKGVTDPEQKRKIIGTEFIRVFEREAAKIGKIDYLVQGTVYPDIVESGTETTAVIKSHHNVGGLPKDMKFKLIEPLNTLFKDEVRQVGAALNLPEDIVWRHPFPGPGLAIRVLGEVTEEKLKILRAADAIMIEEIKKAGLYRKIWQAFAVLPDIRSVGVFDGKRTYAYTIALRAVTGQDGMTADWYRFPYELLEKITHRIVTEVPHVNRVVYDITPKPPATIEWE